MISLRQSAAATLLLALPLSVSACGGGDDKPSKADVKAGMTKMLKKEAGGTASEDSAATKVSGCLVDTTYSKLSGKALSAIAKADENAKALTKDDEKTLDAATDSCKKKLGG